MKIKKSRIIIPALALLIGASLAGSISGTVAWYQYSTRTNVAFIGSSVGASGNLQIRFVGDTDWKTRLTIEDIGEKLAEGDYATDLTPITAGGIDKNANLPLTGTEPLFYSNPTVGVGPQENWLKASKANYAQIKLQLRYVDKEGATPANAAKKIYLSDLLIQEDSSNTGADISDALRIHVSTYESIAPATKSNFLISKNGGQTVTYGKLDLDGDGSPDKGYDANDKYGFNANRTSENPTGLTDVVYGTANSSQVCYAADSSAAALSGRKYFDSTGAQKDDALVHPILAKTVANSLDLENLTYDHDGVSTTANVSKSIGSVVASETNFLNVDITIWLEGWHQFSKTVPDVDNPDYDPNAENPLTKQVGSAIWDADTIGSYFDIGFEFAVDPNE